MTSETDRPFIVPCPSCGETNAVDAQTPEEGRPFSCNNCGLEYFDPAEAERRIRSMAEPCGCGLENCELLASDYPYCSGIDCGEHHRRPVAGETDDPWCPVDFNGAVLDELDKLPADEPVDYDAVAATVRERFAAALT